MRTSRIEEPMNRVATTLLVNLTSEEPLPASQLLRINADARLGMIKELNTVITAAESAAIEIVNRFVDSFDVPSVDDVKYQWLDGVELVQHFDSVSDTPISDNLGNLFASSFMPLCRLRVQETLLSIPYTIRLPAGCFFSRRPKG